MKIKIILFILFLSITAKGQFNTQIKGLIKNMQINADSIYFFSGNLNKNYYGNPKMSALLTNNNFLFNGKFSYPQRYYCILKSQMGKIPARPGVFFFDKTTTTTALDSLSYLNITNGQTGNEYKNKFVPYFLNSNETSIESYMWNNSDKFDNKLLNYTILNNESYVSLWFLIERFAISGYSELFATILNSFSKKMKSEKLWHIVYKEFQNIKIKENEKFPELLLQNTNLLPEKLTIPISKYTLVDFWFSRCRPCLEEMPKWINLYNLYNSKGFNVVGVSSDKTENVKPYWQKRIVEQGIPWKNYLDENAVFCVSEKINSFPTNFLLNEKGEVIQKNIEPEDLETILSENLK